MATELAKGYIDLTLDYKGFVLASTLVKTKLQKMHEHMLKVQHSARRMLLVGSATIAGVIKAYASFEEQLANVSTMLLDHTMHLMPKYAEQI